MITLKTPFGSFVRVSEDASKKLLTLGYVIQEPVKETPKPAPKPKKTPAKKRATPPKEV